MKTYPFGKYTGEEIRKMTNDEFVMLFSDYVNFKREV